VKTDWTIFQLHALRFAACQKLHRIAVDQRYVSQVERDVLTGRFQTKSPLQLCDVFEVDSATQRKDDSPITRPLNSQPEWREVLRAYDYNAVVASHHARTPWSYVGAGLEIPNGTDHDCGHCRQFLLLFSLIV
jgi:hypothetical protein